MKQCVYGVLLSLLAATAPAQIQNPGFETGDLTGWSTADGSFIEVGGGAGEENSGSFGALINYTSGSIQRELHQTVSGLADGAWYLTAWIQLLDGNQTVHLRANDDGAPGWEHDLVITGVGADQRYSFIRYALPVTVTGGDLEIGIEFNLPDGAFVAGVDDFELVPAALYDWREGKNLDMNQGYRELGAFPANTRQKRGWAINGHNAGGWRLPADTVHRGADNLLLYTPSVYGPTNLYQVLCGVPDGDYYLTCFMRTGGGANRCRLTAVSDGQTFTTGDFHQPYDFGASHSGYSPVVLPVSVGDGYLWIDLEMQELLAGGDSIACDSWDLIPVEDYQPVVNPGFELEDYGWTFSRNPFFEANPAQNYQGDEIAKFWNGSAYSATASQTLTGVAQGVYNMSCMVWGYQGSTTATLTIDNSVDPPYTMQFTGFSPGGGWEEPGPLGFTVGAGGSLSVSIRLDSAAGVECAIDAVSTNFLGLPVELSDFGSE